MTTLNIDAPFTDYMAGLVPVEALCFPQVPRLIRMHRDQAALFPLKAAGCLFI